MLESGGANTFSGSTTVSSGTLCLNNSNNTTAISVAPNATLGGSGTASSATATIQPGGIVEGGSGGAGSLTLALTFNGSGTVDAYNVAAFSSSASVAAVNVTTLTTTAATITVNVLGTLPAGNGADHILYYSSGSILGSGSGSFVLGSPISIGRKNYSLVSSGNYLDFSYSVDYPIWTGAGNAVWSSPRTAAELGLGLQRAGTDFVAGDTVFFNDSASGGSVVTVSITGSVNPLTTTFMNSTKSYTLTGSGSIVDPNGTTSGNLIVSETGSPTGR